MTASARVLRLLPRQLTMPLRLALTPPSRAAARGYLLMLLQQQPHRCWPRAAAAVFSASSSRCEQYPRAPIAAAPGATCPHPHERKGEADGEVARGGEKAAAGAQQDGSSGAGSPSPPAPKDKEALIRAAAAAGRKGRSGAPPSPRQRGRTAKPQVNKPARPGPPKQGRGGGGGIIHDVPPSSSSASTTKSSSSSTSSSTRLRATKKQESED